MEYVQENGINQQARILFCKNGTDFLVLVEKLRIKSEPLNLRISGSKIVPYQ